MNEPSSAGRGSVELAPDRAFVVHLAANADGPYLGRVEHVPSGNWTYFPTFADLVAFVESTPRPDDRTTTRTPAEENP